MTATSRSEAPFEDSERPPCPAELPHLPPTRNFAFYATLVFAVGPLWSIPPLSWAFVLYSLISGSVWSYTGLKLLFFVWALAEVRTIATDACPLFNAQYTDFLLRVLFLASAVRFGAVPYSCRRDARAPDHLYARPESWTRRSS